VLFCGALFSLAFAIVLTPWIIRNWRVFHLFQPLAPAHAEMPGEFVPRGYGLWLRTWLDDDSYIAPLLWSLDTEPIDFEDFPPYAFDSPEEKSRVAALIDRYNHPDGAPGGGRITSKSTRNAATFTFCGKRESRSQPEKVAIEFKCQQRGRRQRRG
jgi:hypothetical protein